VVSVDGRAFNQPWNESVVIPAGETIYLSTAQRYDILIDTTSRANASKRGKLPVTFEFQDWISRRRQNEGDAAYEGYAFTTISV
jgi:hypothetical protein